MEEAGGVRVETFWGIMERKLELTPEVKNLIKTITRSEVQALWKDMFLSPLLLAFTIAGGALATLMAVWSVVYATPFAIVAVLSYRTYRKQKQARAAQHESAI